MKIEDLRKDYDELQVKYGAKELDSIYNGGCEKNPDICFVFMNPTGKNIASDKSWKGRKSPWLGTKNIWKLFYKVDLLSEETFNKIQEKKPKEWDYEFCNYVYEEIEKNKLFITNLGKCTQIDARPLPDEVLKKYLDLLFKEINIIKPKIIITFGNQVSSIILNKKISVSENRKKCHKIQINKNEYKVYPVYYPVGNGIFNIDKSIEDIKNKKIDVILIKDLSRLGRNYIETGNFAEVVFPAMGVSVISVDENYEIDSSDYYSDDYLALKNLFNDMYAKDISKKVRSSLIVKKQNL